MIPDFQGWSVGGTDQVPGVLGVIQPAENPYQASHAIFVRKGARQAFPGADEIPALFRHRLMSLRGFDADNSMVDADIAEGSELDAAIDRMFADPAIAYIHLHNAKPGCFAASVTRE